MENYYDGKKEFGINALQFTLEEGRYASKYVTLPTANLSSLIEMIHSFVRWVETKPLSSPVNLDWISKSTQWYTTLLQCIQSKRQRLDVSMSNVETGNKYRLPLWLISEGLTDFMRRVNRFVAQLSAEVSHYEDQSAVKLVAYSSLENGTPFDLILPQWKTLDESNVPFYKLIDSMYVSKDEFRKENKDFKFLLTTLFRSSHPEMSQFDAMRSPRVNHKIKQRAVRNLETLSTLSFAQACIYFYSVDKRMLLLLFQYVISCEPSFVSNFMRHFEWMQIERDLWTYLQMAVIIKDDPELLAEVHGHMCAWRMGSFHMTFEGKSIQMRNATISRSYSESDMVNFTLMTQSTPRPLDNDMKSISKSTPPSARGQPRRIDDPSVHKFPFPDMAAYAKQMYLSVRLNACECFNHLKMTYNEFYETLYESHMNLNKLSTDLPSQTLSELLILQYHH